MPWPGSYASAYYAMLVYHRTDHSVAIMREGFRDATGYYLTAQEFTGAWVSDSPLDENEGADGDAVIKVDIPEALFVEHEWVEEGKVYREALIPAAELNKFGRRVLSEDEVEEL